MSGFVCHDIDMFRMEEPMPRPRKSRTSPDLITKQLQKMVDQRVHELFAALGKAMLPKLQTQTVGILKFMGVDPTPESFRDFLTTFADFYQGEPANEERMISMLQKFLEKYGEQIQAHQLDKILTAMKEK